MSAAEFCRCFVCGRALAPDGERIIHREMVPPPDERRRLGLEDDVEFVGPLCDLCLDQMVLNMKRCAEDPTDPLSGVARAALRGMGIV